MTNIVLWIERVVVCGCGSGITVTATKQMWPILFKDTQFPLPYTTISP